eukprot:gene29161-36163_t
MNVVILAAGMGKRMQSALPKVLHPLAGKPLLSHVIDTARGLSPVKLCVIYGHGGAAVLEQLEKEKQVPGADISAALQEPQLGTGHAVMQALPVLDEAHPTLILYGDVPLTTSASLQRQMRCASGLLSFGVKGGLAQGVTFIESAQFMSHLVNIGDTRTLISHPASTTHRQLDDAQQLAAGVPPDMVRISVGLENLDDILWDIDQALDKASR